MIHTAADISTISAPFLDMSILQSALLTSATGSAEPNLLMNPWVGLIGLGVLVLSGAVAVIREIQIEEEDGI
ncbi:MAG: hypothetical protein CMK09_17625 [Ponticaulis sp.]|nr:hypothetical protein [Ponticaulis sp.]|tara:strand:- start:21256 stop:21471 length:216 start_codon:yes stop_codon:yes gene_type:complete